MKLWKPKSLGSWITTALGLVSVTVGIILGVRQLIPKPEPPQLSVVFILDVSPAMRKPLGETTKLAEAQDSILENVASFPGVSTSLRLVSAGCKAAYTPPTVGFGKNSAARYKDVFTDLAAQPVSTYREGLNSAANDLTTKKLIQDSEQKLLILFVANSGCERRLSAFPIGGGLSIQFFWLGASSGDLGRVRKQLEDLGFTEVRVRRIETKNELKAAVNRTVRTRSDTPPIVPTTITAPTTSAESTTQTSTGDTTDITVPDVTGQSQADAIMNLEGSGLTPSVDFEDVSDMSQDGIVVTQSPTGGTDAASDKTVSITVGRYVRPTAPTRAPTTQAPTSAQQPRQP